MNNENRIAPRPYSITELARLYQVSNRVMKNWLRPLASAIGEKIGRYYTIRQVEIIFEELGEPE